MSIFRVPLLRIDRLETAVAGLPLLIDGTFEAEQKRNSRSPNPNLSWWENAWEKIAGCAQRLGGSTPAGQQRRHADCARPKMYFVRENLRLRLLDARTALMQHNSEVYQSDLNNTPKPR